MKVHGNSVIIDKTVEDFMELRVNQGMNTADIAAEFLVSKPTLYRWMKERGLVGTKRGVRLVHKITVPQYLLQKSFYAKDDEIREAYGMTTYEMNRFKSENGLAFKRKRKKRVSA